MIQLRRSPESHSRLPVLRESSQEPAVCLRPTGFIGGRSRLRITGLPSFVAYRILDALIGRGDLKNDLTQGACLPIVTENVSFRFVQHKNLGVEFRPLPALSRPVLQAYANRHETKISRLRN